MSVFKKIYLFIGCGGEVFIATCELFLVAESGGLSSLQCTGFSLRGLLLLGLILLWSTARVPGPQ